MKRRLYFLLPDVTHTRTVINELMMAGLTENHVHAMARPGIDLEELPLATGPQRRDLGERVETVLWDGNLVVFFAALFTLIVLAYLQIAWYWMLLPAAIVLITFLLGEEFTRRVPGVRLAEFEDALQHGEILLMIDVPVSDVDRVETLVHRRHPEAVTGGVGWHVDALHT